MWAEPYLLGMAALALTAMGFSAILISLALDQLLDRDTTVVPDRPTLRGTWMTVVNFFVILVLSLLPLVALYAIEQGNLGLTEQAVWRGASGLVAVYLVVGLLFMVRSYFKRYAKGRTFHEQRVSRYMIVGFVFFVVLVVLNGVNVSHGLGTLYLAVLSIYFIGILTWIGLVMRYTLDKALKEKMESNTD